MMQGVGNSGSSGPAAITAAEVSASTVDTKKNVTEDPNAPKFGEVLNRIQSKYGAKEDKPREIKKALGKDDFLRIMITQMKHQDPTQPFKAEQMAEQMAQFTSVEQLQNLNQAMTKMANQQNPMERLAMTGLIGKNVTIDRDRFPHNEGDPETLSFTLPKDAKETRLAILSDSGEVIIEKDLGELKTGDNSFQWDGKKTNSLPTKSGGFIFRIEAKDERGQVIQTNPHAQAKVVGVSFEGNEPVLLVGDINRPSKVTMRNVVRIDEGGVTQQIPGAKPISGASAAAPVQTPMTGLSSATEPAIIGFQKGVGSSTLAPTDLPASAQAALAKLQEAPIEKGFPNGLQDSEEARAPNHATIEKGGNKQ